MPVSHFWGSIYRNILPSLTQLVAHLSVIYHRPTRSTGPPVISSPTTTFGKIQAKGLFCFFSLGPHHDQLGFANEENLRQIWTRSGTESCKWRRIVCEVFVSRCKFGCTVAPVWVHAPPCKGRRQYFSDSRRKKRTSPHSLIELGQTIFLWQKPVKVFPLLSQDQLFVITDNTSAVLGILQPKKDQGQERRASGIVHGSPHSIGHITSRQCAWQTSNNHGRHAG